MTDVAPPMESVRGASTTLPELAITVVDGIAHAHAATPTLEFTLEVANRNRHAIKTGMLTSQIRIAAPRRGYAIEEQAQLLEVFGTPDQWGASVRSLFWTHSTFVLPPFQERAQVTLLVPCTYDFDVLATKYLHALVDGDVPLEFLFSGSVFFLDDEGMLKTARLSWETDATYRLPVRVWRDMMEAYYAGSVWVRLHRESFDRLSAFKTARRLANWDQAIEAVLPNAPARGA